MDAEIIRENIKNGVYSPKIKYPKTRRYKEGHVFDEEKSVKWNREELERQNAEIKRQLDEYRTVQRESANNFEKDVIDYLLDDFYLEDNEEIARKIYSKAYSEGHSSGMYEVLNEAIDIADFIEDIIKIIK